jgi:hypothetical protein
MFLLSQPFSNHRCDQSEQQSGHHLTDAEFAKFKNARVLNADDVLDMHTFLKEFNSDFSGLFGYKKV